MTHLVFIASSNYRDHNKLTRFLYEAIFHVTPTQIVVRSTALQSVACSRISIRVVRLIRYAFTRLRVIIRRKCSQCFACSTRHNKRVQHMPQLSIVFPLLGFDEKRIPLLLFGVDFDRGFNYSFNYCRGFSLFSNSFHGIPSNIKRCSQSKWRVYFYQ